jgi:voltage-gated potassium channel
MMGLAVFVLVMLIIEMCFTLDPLTQTWFGYSDTAILVIFAADYFYRLFKSERKWKFIKENIFDLIAIIPFNSVFMLARLTRLFRLLKLLKLLKLVSYGARFLKRFEKFFKTNNFIYVLLITVILIIVGSLLISSVEDMTFSDSIWWAFVTATTVGYGDISPKTDAGRLVAVFLMMM